MEINQIFKNVLLVNDGQVMDCDLQVKGERIYKIGQNLSDPNAKIIDGEGKYLIPGCIDDQVHFREPGLTHKADIFSESRAAAAGGVTSYMEMPNTIPNTLTKDLLEQKYRIASENSAVNFSFFMGVSLDNYENIMSVDYRHVCGIKIFMGSSTGGMLVDDPKVLERIFSNANALIATHCEDESIIRINLQKLKLQNGEFLKPRDHPSIRNSEACLASSTFAVKLAEKSRTRLHILHISTEEELNLFSNSQPLSDKRITAEVCVHHLYFDDRNYDILGNQIKCNPAIKNLTDRTALRKALKNNILDVVATDHAPHTWEEKNKPFLEAPAGLPLVQHPLLMMLTMGSEEGWDLPFIVQRMAHNPAICFQIKERGFIKEGYFADLVLLDVESTTRVTSDRLFYKCAWSPLMGQTLKGAICGTWVNGLKVFDGKSLSILKPGLRLEFERN